MHEYSQSKYIFWVCELTWKPIFLLLIIFTPILFHDMKTVSGWANSLTQYFPHRVCAIFLGITWNGVEGSVLCGQWCRERLVGKFLTSQDLYYTNVHCKTKKGNYKFIWLWDPFFSRGFNMIRISVRKSCSRTNNLKIPPLFKFGEEHYLSIIELFNY